MDRINLPEGLRNKVLTSIRKEELARARIFFALALLGASSSIVGGVFAFKYMIHGFSQSGFYSYASLLFSDPDVVLTSWKELFLSLAESAPFAGITFSLVALTFLFVSVRMLAKSIRPHLVPTFSN